MNILSEKTDFLLFIAFNLKQENHLFKLKICLKKIAKTLSNNEWLAC
jgi:hypothetical protein